MKRLFFLWVFLATMFASCQMRPAFAQAFAQPPLEGETMTSGWITIANQSEVDSLKLEITALKEEMSELREQQNATALLNDQVIEALLDRIEKLEQVKKFTLRDLIDGSWQPDKMP